MGIKLSLIAMQNPSANGIAKKIVGINKVVLKHCMTVCPGQRWWEALPDVSMGYPDSSSKYYKVTPFF